MKHFLYLFKEFEICAISRKMHKGLMVLFLAQLKQHAGLNIETVIKSYMRRQERLPFG